MPSVVPDVLFGELVVERNPPGHRRRLAKAAAGEEAAEPADDVAERDPRREDIGHRPGGHLVAPHVPERDGDCRDQSAIEDTCGAKQVEELLPVPPELVALDDDEHQLGADEGADDDPDAQIHDLVRVEAALSTPDDRELEAKQVRGCEQQPVRVDREPANLKQDGMHVCVRGRSYRGARGSRQP